MAIFEKIKKNLRKNLFDKIKTFVVLTSIKMVSSASFQKSRIWFFSDLLILGSLYLNVWSVFCLSTNVFLWSFPRLLNWSASSEERTPVQREKDEDGKDCRSIKNNPKATSSGSEAENLNFISSRSPLFHPSPPVQISSEFE